MENELKPCPHCGGKNIYVDGYEHTSGHRFRVVCLDCMATVDPGTIQQKHTAIELWNRRAEPENNPLTLEQLKRMGGKPVWIKDEIGKGWFLIGGFDGKFLHLYGMSIRVKEPISAYDKTWLAYAHKPEEPNEK